jgi:hypothetical protein
MFACGVEFFVFPFAIWERKVETIIVLILFVWVCNVVCHIRERIQIQDD